jgi:predicted pyridoxine 5'-phosphate oxidase superfamily flavin-nucleotide-binding protein
VRVDDVDDDRDDVAGHHASDHVDAGEALDASRLDFVARVDTAFVASRHAERGADVSHRGGRPGFLVPLDARTIRVPDYAGNGLYQTLGNLLVDPRAGLTLVDFPRRRVLSLTGTAQVRFDDAVADATGDTGRSWTLTVERWIELPLSASWKLVEPSPFNPPLAERCPRRC